jgi:peptidoglycan hydrolase-like protein with peptidoglycan-binding domain
MLNALPTLKQGDKDGPGKIEFVGRMQVLITFIGKVNKIEAASSLADDGDFGPHTVNALLAIQAFFGLHNSSEYQQRVCGPQTWAALITAHA